MHVHTTWRRLRVTRVRVCAQVRVISGLSIRYELYTNPLIHHILYMQHNIKIYSVRDYLSFFLGTGDVAQRETSDRAVKL